MSKKPPVPEQSPGTGQVMTPQAPGATLTGDGAGEALPAIPEAATPPATPHEWNDEFVGVGGTYIVVDGRRQPAP